MTGDQSRPRPTLDEYLDHVVEGDRRDQAARWLKDDPSAAAAADLQARIDGSLHRLLSPAAPAAIPAPAQPASFPLPRRRIILIAAAAAAVLLAVSAVVLVPFLEPRPDRLGQIYRAELAGGFTPQEVCTTPDQFAGWLQKNYGEPLYPAPDQSVELLGWSYGTAVTSYSGVLLTKVDGQPVVVVVDRAASEGRRLPTPDDPALNIHRSRLGGLILYEVTPLAQPRVLPLLSEQPRDRS
ncbi:MAG: hypothetical protein WD749_10865 [Phycisphaerales bacterium]